ncbi:hypothetical protein [Noviherbaspirillum sp. Root189]|uniref:hypothetical protein n=1 Tax=Noviherbaspirillum sp. Root189 TaxID=1736487 RepID=UPI00070FC784|nr:hypothetical protein [Noviherbaspirillum sp. Root189]KRB73464.1 hypothetical protein ASE07_06320 [Noviherbaspirillum sp. Root189]
MSKAFAVFLQDLRDGRAHSELSGQLEELISKVKETGKAGGITLKIKIKPASRGGDVDKVTVSDLISVDLPKPERGEDFFWLTDDNDLSRNHPRQQSLELREAASSKPSNLKEASK